MYINISKVDFGRCYSGPGGGEEVEEYYGMYITTASDSAISVIPNENYYNLHSKYLKYSFDGKKWKNWNGNVNIEPEQKMYLKGEDDYVWNSSTSGKLITSSGYYNVGGDISSLTNEIVEVKDYTFYSLFYSDSYIKDCSNLILPATTLANRCYSNMFLGCTSLVAAPALNATELADRCYSSMFDGCTSLTTAPELPATTLTQGCYEFMFHGCTSLTTAPELPVTTLKHECYRGMFENCTSLTAAPELPATTLADDCYQYMFQDCSSLTTAPELHATTLSRYCYCGMFFGCRNLKNITMLATDISALFCLEDWVRNVAYTGTFTKAASMTTLPSGGSGIPSGWTVVDYGAA